MNNSTNEVINRMQEMQSNLVGQHYEQYCDLYALYKKQKENYSLDLGIQHAGEGIKLPNGITIIAGMTGHGKSMLANSIAYRAVAADKNVCYITLEITKEHMFYQMLSIKSFLDNTNEEKIISHSTIKKRELSSKQEDYVFNELWPSFKSMKGNLHILTEWDFDTSSFKSLIGKLIEVEEYSIKQTGRGIDLLIVDYIQLFKNYTDDNSGGTSEYTVIAKWVNGFRQLSVNYLALKREIPVILVSQLNREAWKLEDKRQNMKAQNQNEKEQRFNSKFPSNYKPKTEPDVVVGISQIAGSTEIAKAATQIITIYTDDGLKLSNQCKIQMLKNRDGKCEEMANINYMNPKYYWVGNETSNDDNYIYEGALEDLIELPSANEIGIL